MVKSIRDIAKRSAGRPKTTGPGTGILVKMHDPHLGAIDAWIVKQKDPGLTRPEAIRRLVELGLTVKTKSGPTSRMRATRAAELAAEALASLSVGAADTSEQADRRRRLTKGPLEFREHRVDLPKAKPK
jgi:hypothetical protein